MPAGRSISGFEMWRKLQACRRRVRAPPRNSVRRRVERPPPRRPRPGAQCGEGTYEGGRHGNLSAETAIYGLRTGRGRAIPSELEVDADHPHVGGVRGPGCRCGCTRPARRWARTEGPRPRRRPRPSRCCWSCTVERLVQIVPHHPDAAVEVDDGDRQDRQNGCVRALGLVLRRLRTVLSWPCPGSM